MLSNKRITITADSIVNEAKIATHSAILTLDQEEMSLTSRYLDKDACETNETTIKADQQAFEDYVYSLYTTDTVYI